ARRGVVGQVRVRGRDQRAAGRERQRRHQDERAKHGRSMVWRRRRESGGNNARRAAGTYKWGRAPRETTNAGRPPIDEPPSVLARRRRDTAGPSSGTSASSGSGRLVAARSTDQTNESG